MRPQGKRWRKAVLKLPLEAEEARGQYGSFSATGEAPSVQKDLLVSLCLCEKEAIGH